jgi:hypothetical protein
MGLFRHVKDLPGGFDQQEDAPTEQDQFLPTETISPHGDEVAVQLHHP